MVTGFLQLNKVVEVWRIAAKLLSEGAMLQTMLITQIEALMQLGDLRQSKSLLDKLSDKESDEVQLLRAKLCLYSDKVSEPSGWLAHDMLSLPF